MKILRFPVRQARPPLVVSRIATLETLLSECRTRQTHLHEEGRRLKLSLQRLAALTRDLVRSSEDLKRSAGRLRSCHHRIGPKAPSP
jgi:hypothetical protein